jgi:hypothetical protein
MEIYRGMKKVRAAKSDPAFELRDRLLGGIRQGDILAAMRRAPLMDGHAFDV